MLAMKNNLSSNHLFSPLFLSLRLSVCLQEVCSGNLRTRRRHLSSQGSSVHPSPPNQPTEFSYNRHQTVRCLDITLHHLTFFTERWRSLSLESRRREAGKSYIYNPACYFKLCCGRGASLLGEGLRLTRKRKGPSNDCVNTGHIYKFIHYFNASKERNLGLSIEY